MNEKDNKSDLLANISNIGRFLLQTIWVNDFPISYRQQEKKRDISRYLGRYLKQWLY